MDSLPLRQLIHSPALSISSGPEVTKPPVPSILVMVFCSSRSSPSGPSGRWVGAKGGRRREGKRLQHILSWLCHFRSESQGGMLMGPPDCSAWALERTLCSSPEHADTRASSLGCCTLSFLCLTVEPTGKCQRILTLSLPACPPSHLSFKVQPLPLCSGYPARNSSWPGGGCFLSQFW